MRRGIYPIGDPVLIGAVIGQRMATLCVPWLVRQRVQRRWAGESTRGGGCTNVWPGVVRILCPAFQ